jgi:hypothetical protein
VELSVRAGSKPLLNQDGRPHVGGSRRVLARTGARKSPTAPQRSEAVSEAQCCSDHRRRRGWSVQVVTHHDDDRTGKRGDCIEIRVQHDWNVRDEHVTQHSAADTGQHAEQRSHDSAEAVAERLLRARDGKERQAGRIEGQYEIA